MRHLALGIVLLWPLVIAPAAGAQDTPPGRMDDQMRAEVEQRFAERVRAELQLTDEQATRVRATAKDYGARRKELRDRERAVRGALADQLRPGIAAIDDSVARLTDDLVDLRVNYMESYRRELKDLSTFLTPVQRARLIILREQLVRAARAARDNQLRQQARERVNRPRR
jgi:hypothetical protein